MSRNRNPDRRPSGAVYVLQSRPPNSYRVSPRQHRSSELSPEATKLKHDGAYAATALQNVGGSPEKLSGNDSLTLGMSISCSSEGRRSRTRELFSSQITDFQFLAAHVTATV